MLASTAWIGDPRGTGRAGSVDGEYAYFVRSYYADPDAVVATTDYGTEFDSIVADGRGNAFGTQSCPEKSGEAGASSGTP